MSLEQKINDDIKAAMLAKEKEKLNALRAIKFETDKTEWQDVMEHENENNNVEP